MTQKRRRNPHARAGIAFEPVEPRQLLAGTIQGVAWNDLNDSGARDAGEPTLPGWTIYLDANHNAKLDAGETSTVTGGDGAYAFTGLAAGNYLIGEVVKPGWRQTHPAVTAAAAAAAPALGASAASSSDAVTAAIRRAANLSQYSATTIAKARQWVVAPTRKTTLASIVSRTGAIGATPTKALANTYVLVFPPGVSGTKAVGRLGGEAGLSWFYPLVSRQQSTRSVAPVGAAAPNDPLFPQQWHLSNTANPGSDLDVLSAWDLAQGNGVKVAVVDDGVQYTHPDLAANYDAADSYDFNDNDSDPMPSVSNADFHGTQTAGLVAARGNNGIGVSGVAPQATFAGLRLIAADTTDAQEAAALAYHDDVLSIYSNSWGPEDDGTRLEGPGSMTLAAMQNAVTTGRGGKGNIYVWAAGNGLQNKDNVNYDGYANSRYVIATTALNEQGKQAYYAEPGAPIFVSAFGGDDSPGITTTDLVGMAGDSTTDYNSDFGGTSAVAPEVSGVVALMLQANPNLTWRDVKHILADTAVKNDPTDAGWVRNGAGHWVNHKYGFGQVDAAAAVRAAIGWQNVGFEQSVTSGTITVNQSIPDNNTSTGVTSTTYVDALMKVENVEVVFTATHPRRGDLRVVLTSPDGTQSILAERHDKAQIDANYSSWTFTSTHDWDEIARGTWTLKVTDERGGSVGTFNSWKLNVYGTTVSGENYVSLAVNATLAGQDFGNRALPGARVSAAGFPLSGGAQRLVFTFDKDVAGSISADDLVLVNQTTGATVATGATNLVYDAASRTATWTFPLVTKGILADGDYVARLKAGGVTLADGSMLDGNGDGMGGDDFTFAFTFLQGDLTGDRTVDSADLAILLRNLNTPATGWDHGDLDFDGKIGFGDYQAMQVAYHHTLPAASPSAGAAGAAGEMLSEEAVMVPVVGTPASTAASTTAAATPIDSKKPTRAPRPVASSKPVAAAPPRPVATSAVFSVRTLGWRDVDLLESPPLAI